MEIFNLDKFSVSGNRMAYFEKEILPQIAMINDVTKRPNKSFTWDTEKFGTVDYYPLGDRFLIRESNTWHSNGINFIYDKL